MRYEVVITDAQGQSTTYSVELKRAADPGAGVNDKWECRLDGQAFTFDSSQPEADVLSMLVAGRSYEVRRDANGFGNELTIAVAGQRYAAEVSDPRSLRGRKVKAGTAEGPKKIKAPMPGKVVRILAPEGTAVEAGQAVIVIEAMKMQNELKAPKTGIVKKIMAAEGATVNAGDALAVIE